MSALVPFVLATGMAVCAGLFRFRPGREAALIALIGGWLVLPVAPYPDQVFARPAGYGGSMQALAVPTGIWLNKATMIGLGCLLGVLLFDAGALRRLRFTRLDLPLAVWCVVPTASALANGLPLAEGLAQSRYLALSWGVPYLLGRAYFGDNESLAKFGEGLALAGLAAAPLCLVEIVLGPSLYGRVYGRQPYQHVGEGRWLGTRPVLLFEDGNQLGMWTAVAAVAAAWLWRSGRLRPVARVRGDAAAALLVAVCLACQSHTGVILMLAVVLPLAASRWLSGASRPSYAATAALAVVAATAAPARAAGSGDLRERVRGAFTGMGKGSFTWRLARYEEFLPKALQRPLLGWGLADWPSTAWTVLVDPVGLSLWFLTFGTYGAAGLLASFALVALPVAEVVKWLPLRAWLNPGCAGVTLAAALLAVNAADATLNSVLLLPVLACAGGLNSWALQRYQGV